MLNINNLNLKKNKLSSSKRKKKSEISSKNENLINNKQNRFINMLSSNEVENLSKNIYDFVKKIELQGDFLKEHPNKKEFLKYKSLLQNFLRKVLKDSVITKKVKNIKQKEYIISDIIDEKLFELGKFILMQEKDNLAIAETIETLKGLVYDSAKDIIGN